jgi:tetratricopeptide (TPR) repeat protein
MMKITCEQFGLSGRSLTTWLMSVGMALGVMAPPAALAHADLLAAIDRVTKQIDADPKNAALHLWRGDLYRAHSDWKLAERDYDRVTQLDPRLDEVILARGKLRFESGQNAAAKIDLDKYLAVHTNHVEALITRAQVLTKLGERRAAVYDFSLALAQGTQPMPDYYLQRARLQVEEGDTDSALHGLDEGLSRLGPLVMLQLYAIDLECARQHFDDALRRLESVSARSERKERWLVQRGEILVQARRQAEAQAAFAAALKAIESLPSRQQGTPLLLELKKRASSALVQK